MSTSVQDKYGPQILQPTANNRNQQRVETRHSATNRKPISDRGTPTTNRVAALDKAPPDHGRKETFVPDGVLFLRVGIRNLSIESHCFVSYLRRYYVLKRRKACTYPAIVVLLVITLGTTVIVAWLCRLEMVHCAVPPLFWTSRARKIELR